MRWRGLSLGPLLSSGVRVAFDSAERRPLALRRFATVPEEAWPPLPWPPEPHGNVARLVWAERSAEGVVLASELSLGPTLAPLARTAQPPGVVAGLCAQLLSGLEAIHRAGRAHGGLHPGSCVLDVGAGTLRIAELGVAACMGVPAPGDARALYALPGASRPTEAGDVYAVGRIAEALLRGGPPQLPSSPLPEGAPGCDRLGSWIARCQSPDASLRFPDARSAREALVSLGPEGEPAFAHVPGGAWLRDRRLAERALGRLALLGAGGGAGPADYLDAVSSMRAAALWQRLGLAGCGALLLSVALAGRVAGNAGGPTATETASPAALAVLQGALRSSDSVIGVPANAPLEVALLEPEASRLLAAEDRVTGDGGTAAELLGGEVAVPLAALRAALAQFRRRAAPCATRLAGAAKAALADADPGASGELERTVQLLAADRLGASPDRPDAESATRAALRVPDSPMLDRVVDRVAAEPELAACVQTLAEPAARVQAALAACREPLEVLAVPLSPGDAAGADADGGSGPPLSGEAESSGGSTP